MTKKLFFLIMFFVMIIPFVAAKYPAGHCYDIYYLTRNSDSPAVQECSGMEQFMAAGNIGADAYVSGYVEGEYVSYIGSHNKNFCYNLRREAGTDKELRCYALGACLHQNQDFPNHYSAIPNIIDKSALNNLLAHGLFETYQDNWRKDSLKGGAVGGVSSADIEYCERNAYNIFLCGDGQVCSSNKFVAATVKAGNFDPQYVVDSISFVGKNLAFGNSYSETIWDKQKYSAPPFVSKIVILGVIIGLFWFFINFIFGKGIARWVSSSIGIFIVALALTVYFLIATGRGWMALQYSFGWLADLSFSTGFALVWFFIGIVWAGILFYITRKMGVDWFIALVIGMIILGLCSVMALSANLKISEEFLQKTQRDGLTLSEAYLQSEQLAHADASGLGHYEEGDYIPDGKLDTSQWKYNYITKPTVIAMLLFITWLGFSHIIIKKKGR